MIPPTKVHLEITPSADPDSWVLIPVQGNLGEVVIETPDGSRVVWQPGNISAQVSNSKAQFDIRLLDSTLVGLFTAVNLKR